MTDKLTKEEQETWDIISTPPRPKVWWADYDVNSMYPFQASMLEGIKKGEMTVIMAGRQTGKSQLTTEAIRQMYGRAKRK